MQAKDKKSNIPSKLEIEDIIKLLPHRYPMLLIDRVIEITDTGAVALKNVTFNEPFFQGHFPSKPIMPGVMIIEAMAQAAGMYVFSQVDDPYNKLTYFMSIENAQFRKPVVPGDTLYFHVEKVQSRSNVWKMKGEAKVDGKRVANTTFTAMIVDKEEGK